MQRPPIQNTRIAKANPRKDSSSADAANSRVERGWTEGRDALAGEKG
jgi:hypothetical protein